MLCALASGHFEITDCQMDFILTVNSPMCVHVTSHNPSAMTVKGTFICVTSLQPHRAIVIQFINQWSTRYTVDITLE